MAAEDQSLATYHLLLRTELRPQTAGPLTPSAANPLTSPSRTLRFKSPLQVSTADDAAVGLESQQLLSPQKSVRKMPKQPFKVLDAPALQDDFYLNLVDWSSQNVLAVGLGTCVYLWAAATGKVSKLCDMAEQQDSIASLSWTGKGQHVAVGTKNGEVQIWDAAKCKRLRTMGGHEGRASSLSWASSTLASGSRYVCRWSWGGDAISRMFYENRMLCQASCTCPRLCSA